ncbi:MULTISPECIES: hypothetical protein [Mameliella]|uniref:hypothetical protein n=1 Tax=Mameliella TaxID=1434019 RepID=UPI000B53300D|nr:MULTISPECIES: hypothetical protein [Mameliella]MCR9273250.1 hypothetical protein [Paracoccaceae bacterium]OWV58294.1 hypothetical protein CDZ98_14825 [Mameliella alba]
MSKFDVSDIELVDVWNSSTFGREILAFLHENQALLEEYHREDERLESLDNNEHLAEKLQGNRYFSQFEDLQIHIASALAGRQIRVWHYTRLLDFEVAAMKGAIELSTAERMQARLAELKRRRLLTDQEFEILLEGSSLKTQKEIRENRFFCVPSPIGVTDRGVELLLGNWGGEVVYFHQRNEALRRKLGTLGAPRVAEVAVEVFDPNSRYSLANCMLNTYALDLGFPLYPTNIDLCIKEDPPTARVLAVHTEGERDFHALGCSYPEGAALLSRRHEKCNKLFDD